MKTVIISYETISPVVLANHIEKAFNCISRVRDLDEDYFEITFFGHFDLAELEDVLAEYV